MLFAAETTSAFDSFGPAEWLTVIGLVSGFVGWLFRIDRLVSNLKVSFDAEAKAGTDFRASSIADREHLWLRSREVEQVINGHKERIVRGEARIDHHEKEIEKHAVAIQKWDSWRLREDRKP